MRARRGVVGAESARGVSGCSAILASVSFAGAFHEVAALVLAAAVVGALAVRLRQPLIVAFIAVGVLAAAVSVRHRPGGR